MPARGQAIPIPVGAPSSAKAPDAVSCRCRASTYPGCCRAAVPPACSAERKQRRWMAPLLPASARRGRLHSACAHLLALMHSHLPSSLCSAMRAMKERERMGSGARALWALSYSTGRTIVLRMSLGTLRLHCPPSCSTCRMLTFSRTSHHPQRQPSAKGPSAVCRCVCVPARSTESWPAGPSGRPAAALSGLAGANPTQAEAPEGSPWQCALSRIFPESRVWHHKLQRVPGRKRNSAGACARAVSVRCSCSHVTCSSCVHTFWVAKGAALLCLLPRVCTALIPPISKRRFFNGQESARGCACAHMCVRT